MDANEGKRKMKMTFTAYMKDIGLGYWIFPIITVGAGWLLDRRATDGSGRPGDE